MMEQEGDNAVTSTTTTGKKPFASSHPFSSSEETREREYGLHFDTSSRHIRIFMKPQQPLSTLTNSHTSSTEQQCSSASSPQQQQQTSMESKINLGITESGKDDSMALSCNDNNNSEVLDDVLRYQRQVLRKRQAAKQASQPLSQYKPLEVLFYDEHVVVVNKPSGVLCVPGVNSNPSLLDLVYRDFGSDDITKDRMIVHRLDMDTSGVVIFARTIPVLSLLHQYFRTPSSVHKVYQALVCGHVHANSGEIHLPLQRDHLSPPFMRCATSKSQEAASRVVEGLQHAGWKKIVMKKPKESSTLFRVLNREYYPTSETTTPAGNTIVVDDDVVMENDSHYDENGCQKRLAVTRLELRPLTGRTHQLRVHCAAMGHAIVADPVYGIMGEASSHGGFGYDPSFLCGASLELQQDIDLEVQTKKTNMCLHATELRLNHPMTGEAMIFSSPPPF